jgi:Caspase domain
MGRAAVFGARWILLLLAACARTTAPTAIGPSPDQLRARALPVAPARFALVVGNQGYAEAPLASAHNDATAIASKLRELGFHVALALDASAAQLEGELARFAQSLRVPESVGLFYYAGHGVQLDGTNYLVPVDAKLLDRDDVRQRGVSADDVIGAMSGGRSGPNLIFIDACRNDPFARDAKAGGGARGLAMMNAPDSTLIAYATAPGRVAHEASPHGLYTGALLHYLTTPGATVDQVHRLAAAEVQLVSKGAQVPWLAMSLTSRVCLSGSCGSGPLTALRLVELARIDAGHGKYTSALDLIEQALHAEPQLSPAQRTEAERLKAHAVGRLVTLRLDIAPASATVLVDGALRFSREGLLQVDPGRHEVEVAETGYRSEKVNLGGEPGQQLLLNVALAPLLPGQRDKPHLSVAATTPALPLALPDPSIGSIDETAMRALLEGLSGNRQLEAATKMLDDTLGAELRRVEEDRKKAERAR